MSMISRDAFAREEIHKSPTGSTGECDWCGQKGKLFTFRLETDGGSVSPFKGSFCSTPCFKDYHDIRRRS